MDTATTPRVLTITNNPTLVIGLAFLPQHWDIVSQPDFHAGVDADVVVLDLGTTSRALDALGAFDCEELPPIVIVGDTDAGEVLDGVHLLLRPYTLDQLAAIVTRLLAPESDEHAPDAPELIVERAAQAAPVRDEQQAVPTPAEPEAATDPHPADARTPDAAATDADPTDASATERLSTWVRRLASREHTAEDSPESADRQADRATRDEQPGVAGGSMSADTTVEADTPPAASSALATDPDGQRADESSTRPATAPAAQAASRRGRWVGRRPSDDQGEGELRHRLARALTASAELERLVADLPLLRSIPALALAVTKMLEEQLRADSVAVWRPREDGWHVVAARGLSAIEQSMVVAPKHPLFTEVDASGGALLIDPVDSVQGVVAGIGGAHTESFMAASIAVGPGRYGIVTIGRDDPLRNQDLDMLVSLVLEAALGFALADWFERMAGIAERDRPPSSVS
jgi:hypothetical protein